MELRDCTKDELINFIQSECWYKKDKLAFSVLMFRSENASNKQIAESKLAVDALEEYSDLMAPYNGKKLADIPLDVINRADKAFKRYQKHTAKSNRHNAEYERIHKEIDLVLERKVMVNEDPN